MKVVVVLVTVVLMAPAGHCLAGPAGGMLLRGPGVADHVGLTEEQRQGLEDLFESTEKEMIKADAELRMKRLEIDRLVRSKDPDMREIRKLVNESEKARSSAVLARLERRVRAGQMLSPEQVQKLRRAARQRLGGHSMRAGERAGMRGMRRGEQPGMRGMRRGERPGGQGKPQPEIFRHGPRPMPGEHRGSGGGGGGCYH